MKDNPLLKNAEQLAINIEFLWQTQYICGEIFKK